MPSLARRKNGHPPPIASAAPLMTRISNSTGRQCRRTGLDSRRTCRAAVSLSNDKRVEATRHKLREHAEYTNFDRKGEIVKNMAQSASGVFFKKVKQRP